MVVLYAYLCMNRNSVRIFLYSLSLLYLFSLSTTYQSSTSDHPTTPSTPLKSCNPMQPHPRRRALKRNPIKLIQKTRNRRICIWILAPSVHWALKRVGIVALKGNAWSCLRSNWRRRISPMSSPCCCYVSELRQYVLIKRGTENAYKRSSRKISIGYRRRATATLRTVNCAYVSTSTKICSWLNRTERKFAWASLRWSDGNKRTEAEGHVIRDRTDWIRR